MLTSKSTGAANAFTIDNQLTAGTITFTDTDSDNISGDSASDNAVNATNASLLVNNIAVTSTSNTLDAAIPGVTLTLLQKDPTKTVVVTVARDDESLADRVDDVRRRLQRPRQVRRRAGGRVEQRHGRRDRTRQRAARPAQRVEQRAARRAWNGRLHAPCRSRHRVHANRRAHARSQRAARRRSMPTRRRCSRCLPMPRPGPSPRSIRLIDEYTDAGGFLPDARTRLSDEIARVGRQMDDMQARLAIRRAALQQEFTAADQAMARLNSQKGSLSSFSAILLVDFS